jgi:hypothetical protein
MGLTRITPVNITPLSTGWQTIDVSSYCPPGTTGILYQYINAAAVIGYIFGIRKTGSTDNRPKETCAATQYHGAIGVSTGLSVDIYLNYLTSQSIYMVGYFDADAVFFTNAVDKSLSATATPTIIDISSDTGTDTAIGAIFSVETTNYLQSWFLQKYGSTDNRLQQVRYQCCAFIGVDASEQCEGQIASTTVDFWLIGYFKDGVTFNTNATDISLSGIAAYADLPAIGANENAIIEVVSTSQSHNYAFRKNGDTTDEYHGVPYHGWAVAEADASGIVEGKIANTDVDFYLGGVFGELAVLVSKEDELLFNVEEIARLVSKDDELKFDIGIPISREDTLKFDIEATVDVSKEDELQFDISGITLIAKEDTLEFDIATYTHNEGTIYQNIEVECEAEGYSVRRGEIDVDITIECEASGYTGKVATVDCDIEITCDANSGTVIEGDIVIEAEGTLTIGNLGTSDNSIVVEVEATGYARGAGTVDADIIIELEATAYVGIVGIVDCDIEVSVEALANATLTTGVYECKVVNTKTGAVSLYTNFGFDSFAIVNDKVLATSPTGIHELTGDLDETTKIAASVTTHIVDPNNPVPRRVMDGQLLGSAAGRIKVTITCDDFPSYEDIVSNLTNAIRRARIKFPEGFSGEHYTFKIENVNGCDFDLDEFKIVTQEKSENAEVARNERRVR